MRLNDVLNRVDEGFVSGLLGMAAGFAVGTAAHKNNISPGLVLLGTAATYAAIEKLNPAHRKTVVLTAKDATEAISQQKIISDMINKMSYKLDKMEYVGSTGRKWTLSTK